MTDISLVWWKVSCQFFLQLRAFFNTIQQLQCWRSSAPFHNMLLHWMVVYNSSHNLRWITMSQGFPNKLVRGLFMFLLGYWFYNDLELKPFWEEVHVIFEDLPHFDLGWHSTGDSVDFELDIGNQEGKQAQAVSMKENPDNLNSRKCKW